MSIIVSHCCLLSLTIFPSNIESLHVSHCLPAMVSNYLSLSLKSHGVAACLSHSSIVAGYLSLSLPSQRVASCL